MGLLEGLTIVLISPQPWEHIPISKHHYAIELARRGNTVFFLEPPVQGRDRTVRVARIGNYPGIQIVTYSQWFPYRLRFHARSIFDRMMRFQIKLLREAIPAPIGVTWCFDFNLFSDLRAFGARLNVFHPVDPLSACHQINVARSADLIVSVSEQILANFDRIGTPTYFVNHGLSRPFADLARENLGRDTRQSTGKRVGYSGNLLRPTLNHAVIVRIIKQNPSVEFHFWGPFETKESAPGSSASEVTEFIGFLRQSPNVRLHGVKTPQELASAMQEMDCHILSYSPDIRESDRSNSHKILEYLSTGKVVVSSHISTYASQSELFRMTNTDDDLELPTILQDTLGRLSEFNSISRQDCRRRFALDNTYERQVDRIDSRLSSLREEV